MNTRPLGKHMTGTDLLSAAERDLAAAELVRVLPDFYSRRYENVLIGNIENYIIS